MKKTFLFFFTLLTICSCQFSNKESDISQYEYSTPKDLFDKGNLAMFIQFGPSSNLGGVWKGKTYYGISEWIMRTANISAEEYIEASREFNPSEFDAMKIVNLAKAVGMKYIVISSKHHDGFAMFDSDCNDFNIVDHTRFGRDIIKELADACHQNGLGIGFYYSHCLDWTAPGGGWSKATEQVDFHTYFVEKVYPQVNEITTKYGDLVMVWFDMPGYGISEEETRQLAELVHKNQPNALISSRIGMSYYDFESGDDMDVRPANKEGLWENIDTSNDSWGFADADKNWKSPKDVLIRILSTIARGGTYMLSIGPDGKGNVPELCVKSLTAAGEWIHRYPQVVYDVQASPWNQTLTWGDAVRRDNKIYLLIYNWPADGNIELYGIGNGIKSVRLLDKDKSSRVKFSVDDDWTELKLPSKAPENWINVVEITMNNDEIGLIKEIPITKSAGYEHLSGLLAHAGSCEVKKHAYAAKFGEWHTEWSVSNLGAGGRMTWNFAVKNPGYYKVGIRIKGDDDQEIFHVTTDEGYEVANSRFAAKSYEYRPLGWIKFDKPGIHTITVTMPEGGKPSTEVAGISIQYVDL